MLTSEEEPPNHLPPPTLDSLPPESLYGIFSRLPLSSAGRFAAACSTFAAAFVSLSNNDALFRGALLARLGLLAHYPTAAELEGDAEIAWRDYLREIHLLFCMLGKLGRIDHCGQKYLRWCNGEAADSAQVRHALLGLSLLPPAIEQLYDEKSGMLTEDGQLIIQFWLVGMNTVKERELRALIAKLQILKSQDTNPEARDAVLDLESATEEMICQSGIPLLELLQDDCDADEPSMYFPLSDAQIEAATRHFDVHRFCKLLRWAASDDQGGESASEAASRVPKSKPGGPRLRIMMAEIEQIQCRTIDKFLKVVDLGIVQKICGGSPELRFDNRQAGAFVQLHRLAQCDVDKNVSYWA